MSRSDTLTSSCSFIDGQILTLLCFGNDVRERSTMRHVEIRNWMTHKASNNESGVWMRGTVREKNRGRKPWLNMEFGSRRGDDKDISSWPMK